MCALVICNEFLRLLLLEGNKLCVIEEMFVLFYALGCVTSQESELLCRISIFPSKATEGTIK